MKRNFITIMKKEFARFFGDKRMVFTTILMPGILIYVMYSFMGTGFASINHPDEDHVYEVRTLNCPKSFAFLKEDETMEVEEIQANEMKDVKDSIETEELDVLLVFPEQFDEKVAAYDVTQATEAAPNVAIYYNSTNVNSSAAYSILFGMFDQMEASMVNKFDVNMGEESYDLATEEDVTAMIFSTLLPMLVMIFLFSGCMSIALESIAGEKERGTIATLLVSPMKRNHLAFGKIVSLSMIGLLSGCSSFLGTMLSLPKLMSGNMENMSIGYKTVDYMMLLVIILVTTLIIVGLISVISAFAKSVKEAGTMTTPLMILVMLISITSMVGEGAQTAWYLYLIPVYNSVQCMTGIFSMDYSVLPIIITIVSNLVYSGLLVGVLTKMFNSERIMYT